MRFWTFNVADSAVTVGALMLAFVLWREDRRELADRRRLKQRRAIWCRRRLKRPIAEPPIAQTPIAERKGESI